MIGGGSADRRKYGCRDDATTRRRGWPNASNPLDGDASPSDLSRKQMGVVGTGVILASPDSTPWPVYAAAVAAVAALLGHGLVRLKEARDRRRDEYSRAFAAAMRWTEFPYRIARRLSNEPAEVAPIVEAMHAVQEEIQFHLNWLRSVSDDMAEAYSQLVRSVKAESRPHIEASWRREPAIVPDGMILGDVFPVDVDADVKRFTKEIRRNLSVWRRIST